MRKKNTTVKVDRKQLVKEHNERFQEWYAQQILPIFDHAKERRSFRSRVTDAPVPFVKESI